MKAKILMGSLLLASTLFSSCSDFLEENPKGQLTAESYFQTLDELKMSTVALAKKAQQTQINVNMVYVNWQGDDITTHPASNKQACREIDRFDVPDNNKGANDPWKNHFTLIKAANYVINNAAKTPTSEQEINIAIGQGKYWRAFAYFYLVRTFGPVPMNLDNVNDDYTAPLSSVEDVYKQIVADLEDAEKLLPTSYNDEPRKLFGVNVYITQQAAKATLAAVYMHMAGWPLNKGAEYYAKAAAKAKEVIDGVNSGIYEYKMEEDFKQVYSMGNNYNNETVVGLNTSPFQDWGQDSEFVLTQLFESQSGWADGFGELRFWKRYPAGPRKDIVFQPKIRLSDKENNGKMVNFWDKYTDKEGKQQPYIPEEHPMFSIFTLNVDDNNQTILDQPFDYTKPYNSGVTGGRMTNDHRHRVVRYSEVLLWYAECSARTGQVTELAKDCLKKVRARAVEANQVNVVNGVQIDAMTPEQLAEAAYDEHGWEVAGYWLSLVTRRMDQFRMDRLKDAFAERVANEPVEVAPGVTIQEHVKFTKTAWDQNMMYLPYPAEEAMKNPNLKR